MYLKKLELYGFKSFADRTTLEFRPGITTVIGPNGSGKSNISDAIRWVLGEQSMKSLRGTKSEDIIFAGTVNRKSLGVAEASLVFDNTDGKLPVEYSEVTVTRKIYRSGESGYFINKTPCRLKDVLELFMDTGIGKDGYSIIGQGKIDEILSNKSEDRRNIFEEAAGIVKYRVRKAESEKKLEQTKLNLLRINDILSEIELNIEPLRKQSEKAKKYLELREELKKIEVGLFINNIETYKEKLSKIVEDKAIIDDNNKLEQDKQEKLNELKENLKLEIEKLGLQIESIQNIGFESEKNKEKISSEINLRKERIANNELNFSRFTDEIEDTKQRIKDLEDEKETKQEKKNNLFNNKEKFEKELNEKQKELDELSNKLSAKELEIEDKKKKVEENTDKKYELANIINTLEVNIENIEKRKKQINNEIDISISELDSTRIAKQEIEKEFYDIENNRNKIKEELEKISSQREENEKTIQKFENEINLAQSEYRIKESKLKFLEETEKEKEGYIKSVKALLLECEKNSELKKGSHGVLANIIKTPSEYETAIEMALGAATQNIVTDTENDAKKLVEYLRVNNLGRASFLPISSVKGSKLAKFKNIDGVIGIASDLVKFDKKYEQIVLNLLGRTIIVQNMDTAIKLAKQNNYGFRIVTMKGDIINASGSITGGSVAKKTVNILSRARQIEDLQKELKTLKNKIDKVENKKEEYLKDEDTVMEQITAIEKNMQEIDIVYATDKQKLLAINENIEKIENRLQKLRTELSQLDEQRISNIEDKEKHTKEIEVITEECKELKVAIEQFANMNKDDQKYIDDLNLDITNLKISVSSFNESETSLNEILERIETDIKNNKDSIESKEQQKVSITNTNEQLNNEIEELKEKIKEIDNEVENSSDEIKKLKSEKQQKTIELNTTEENITKQFEILKELNEQSLKIDVKKSKLEQDIDLIVNKLWDEYELTPNTVTEYEKPSNIQNATKSVNEYRKQIKSLGEINVNSIEEYTQTKQRYDFMCEQRLDLENSISKLRKVISNMTSVMKEQFAEKFKMINSNFSEVFKELFGGGKAELTLTDENNILECGIDINVQPPGKKLQNMNLLSGGEKAFTAIAILFAILKINPSPFCVLDEIEAALDDVNVYKYADYLKKFTKNTQFLVITHRKGTMEAADTVYGITMEENGISKLLSMKLK